MSSNIKIGPYMLLETLGVGSFGKVKRAVHSLTGHTVAIKIINRNKVVNQDMIARVKREIQYLKLLRHPHIIKLYEVISTPTSIYMVIEYAGGELFNYIVDNTRLSEDEARRFFQQIVCALEYCHRHKIVHRDLKPEKYAFTRSPEVISGKLYAGPEVDVWSCGVILYVMLCGRLPFDDDYIPLLFKKINGKSDFKAFIDTKMHKICSGIYSLPSFLSPETKYLLTSMLVVDPLKRITIAEIRQNAWFNVGLPEYLKPLPQGITDDIFCNLQEDIISELMKKMNFSRETIIQALEERQNNQIKVAYQLVVDHRRMIENVSPQKPFQSFLATSPPPWNGTEKDGSPAKSMTGSSAGSALKSRLEGDTSDDSTDSPVPSSITVLSTSLPGNSLAKELHRKASLKNTRKERSSSHSDSQSQSSYQNNQQQRRPVSPPAGNPDYSTTTSFHQASVLGNSSLGGGGIPLPSRTNVSSYSSGSNNNPGAVPAATTQRRMKSRPKWYFGIRSRSAPREVMAEIYRALSNLSMKWKIVNAYHLRAKYEYAKGFEVKIELQLYRLDNENYLVDFKYVGQQSEAEIEARGELMRSRNEESLVEKELGSKSIQPLTSNITTDDSNNSGSDAHNSGSTSDATNETDPYPATARAQGAAHIMSGPQDIPQSGHNLDQSENSEMQAHQLKSKHHTVSFETNTDQDPHSTSGDEPSKRLSTLSCMSLPVDPSTSSITTGGAGAGTSAPGILSSSLMQEQQQLKEMNELRQELQHQQRQRDMKQRPTHLLFPKASYQLASVKEVTSPFPFFDVCGKLITELAIGSS
ncbi:Protein kinase [Haplosporangium sp. Z 27]|nr:Protein kinase [Haplosporangium sp. Z 27]